jgi:hypothetical protein
MPAVTGRQDVTSRRARAIDIGETKVPPGRRNRKTNEES